MEYEKSVDFSGDPRKVLDYARDLLVQLNFRVAAIGGSQLNAENTTAYLSTKQNPLLAISELTITAVGSRLSARANLGKLLKMIKVVGVIIILMDVIAVGVLTAVFVKTQPELLPILLSTALPTPLVVVLIYKVQRWQTGKAIDTFLRNVAENAASRG